jgi:hypothetical protein
MEATMAIDTLDYVKELQAAGLDSKIAEAHAMALRDRIVPQLATKQDVKDLGSELRREHWRIAIAVILGIAVLAAVIAVLS